MSKFKYVVVVNGVIREWHEDFLSAEKAARFYENNVRLYGWADILILEVKYANGEVLHA